MGGGWRGGRSIGQVSSRVTRLEYTVSALYLRLHQVDPKTTKTTKTTSRGVPLLEEVGGKIYQVRGVLFGVGGVLDKYAFYLFEDVYFFASVT